MPTVNKQTPQPSLSKSQLAKPSQSRSDTPTPTSKSSSEDAWGLIDKMRILIYGVSGSGKTTLWATFPGPILCLICSGGKKPGELRSVNTPEYRKKIAPRMVNSTRDFEQAMGEAAEFATVVLDHTGGYSDVKLGEIIGKPVPEQKGWGLATQQQYGQLAMQCKEDFRTLLNLPGNVVLIGQERTFGGRDDGMDPDVIKPTVGAALTPSLVGWLNPAVDYIVQTFKAPKMTREEITVGGKKVVTETRSRGVEYCLRVGPHDTFTTKFRVPRGIELPEVIINPTYEKIQQLIQGST